MLPLDHTIGTIVEDDECDIESETNCCLYVSEIHDDSTVSCDTDHTLVWMLYLGTHGSRESCSHGCEGIVEDEGIRRIAWIVASYPDLVESVIEGENIFSCYTLSEYLSELTRSHDRSLGCNLIVSM